MIERDEAMRRWRLGEENLYPVVMVRPDLYERCAVLVRSVAEHLEGVPDVDALVATYRVGDARGDLARAGIDPDELPIEIKPDLVRDAAYNHRARELAMRAPAEEAQRLIRRARAANENTVTIWSIGEIEHSPGYRRVEMSVETGIAVVAMTELDADRMEPLFVLEALQLDPETGESARDEPLAPRREFTDLNDWRTAAGELRASFL